MDEVALSSSGGRTNSIGKGAFSWTGFVEEASMSLSTKAFFSAIFSKSSVEKVLVEVHHHFLPQKLDPHLLPIPLIRLKCCFSRVQLQFAGAVSSEASTSSMVGKTMFRRRKKNVEFLKLETMDGTKK